MFYIEKVDIFEVKIPKDFTIFSSLTVVTKFENHTKKEYTLHFTGKNDYYQYLMDIFTLIIILMFQMDEIWMLEIVKRRTQQHLKWVRTRLKFHHNLR